MTILEYLLAKGNPKEVVRLLARYNLVIVSWKKQMGRNLLYSYTCIPKREPV